MAGGKQQPEVQEQRPGGGPEPEPLVRHAERGEDQSGAAGLNIGPGRHWAGERSLP